MGSIFCEANVSKLSLLLHGSATRPHTMNGESEVTWPYLTKGTGIISLPGPFIQAMVNPHKDDLDVRDGFVPTFLGGLSIGGEVTIFEYPCGMAESRGRLSLPERWEHCGWNKRITEHTHIYICTAAFVEQLFGDMAVAVYIVPNDHEQGCL